MINILIWDDEQATCDTLAALFAPLKEQGVVNPVFHYAWDKAAKALRGDLLWDIVISDLKDATGDAAVFSELWDAERGRSDVQEIIGVPYYGAADKFGGLAPPGNLWGSMLLILAKAQGVPRRLLMSAFTFRDPEADSVALALYHMDVITKVLPKETESTLYALTSQRILAEVEACLREQTPRIVPDVYEVLVVEDCEAGEDEEVRKRLTVRVSEKKREGRPGDPELHGDLTLNGDHAVIFQTIADNDGEPVSSRSLFDALNRTRGQKKQYEPYTARDVELFLKSYKVQLLGEQQGQPIDRMCTVANTLLCEWQRYGANNTPRPGEEGHSCYSLVGYCPKRQMKPCPPEHIANVLETEASIRTKVKELRKFLSALNGMLGSGFSGEAGLIYTVRGRGRGGYALAGSIQYSED